MPEVELHPAFAWDCDACGRQNYLRALPAALSPEDQHEAAVLMGMIEPWQDAGEIPTGVFTEHPERVICPHCEAQFRVAAPE